MTSPTPRTRAGRSLLDELGESPLPGARYAHHVVRDRLPAIEREAVEAERARLRALVARLPTLHNHGVSVAPIPLCADEVRLAVLALIDQEESAPDA